MVTLTNMAAKNVRPGRSAQAHFGSAKCPSPNCPDAKRPDPKRPVAKRQSPERLGPKLRDRTFRGPNVRV